MSRYIFKRCLQALISLVAMSVIIFALVRFTGDPRNVLLSEYASKEQWEAMGVKLGLDQPVHVQYWVFVSNAVRGDFGESIRLREPALPAVAQRFGATLQLAFVAVIIGLIVAIPLGVLSAVKKGGVLDTAGKIAAVLGQSVPPFWLGIILIAVFGVALRLLPVSGLEGPWSFVLPAVTLGWGVSAGIMRLLRSSMLDVLDSEFVKMHRIKGLSERLVIWKHCLKNSMIPVVTYMGVIMGTLLIGSVSVETVFSWPGAGRLAYNAVIWRDYPLIQAITMVMTAAFIFINLLVDISYAYIDPRIRHQ